ncbi:MAG: hypothetical protein V4649_00020 [Bacteroidota bacterium]
MKQVKLILAAALAGGMMFTGCKKSDMGLSNGGVQSDATRGIPSSGMANIKYMIDATPSSQGDMLQWTSGSMAATRLTLDAVKINPKWDMNFVNYSGQVQPSGNDLYGKIELGSVAMPEGKYTAFTFSVFGEPVASGSAIMLDGWFTTVRRSAQGEPGNNATKVPVKMTIDMPMHLSAAWKDTMQVVSGNYYTATMHLDPLLMTEGITQSMMNDAERKDGIIYISSSANRVLFKQVLFNLNRQVKVTFARKDMLQGS